jgi:hypothetical protein
VLAVANCNLAKSKLFSFSVLLHFFAPLLLPKMTEELVSANKALLILTTSTDPKHPASNVLDG